MAVYKQCITGVALRKESVDRKIWGGRGTGKTYGVALRKESVDRKKRFRARLVAGSKVALRKESVDRKSKIAVHSDLH